MNFVDFRVGGLGVGVGEGKSLLVSSSDATVDTNWPDTGLFSLISLVWLCTELFFFF